MKKGPIISHVIGGLSTGGTEMMLARTLPFLPQHHVVVSLTGGGDIADRLRAYDIEVVELHTDRRLTWKNFLVLKRFFRHQKPVVVQTYLWSADVLGRFAARNANVPIILGSIRSHSTTLFFVPHLLFNAWTHPFTSGFISNSQAGKKLYQHLGVPAQKITVIPNGLDLDSLQKIIPVSSPAPAESLILGCVGQLRKEKGHRDLIAALPMILKTIPHAMCVLVGDGPEQSALEKLAAQLHVAHRVKFLGHQKDAIALMKTFRFFILPSHFEGMSNALMEAMACGVPIIATDVAGNRELITHQEHGILIPRKSPKKIADAVKLLYTESRLAKDLASHARNRALNEFSITQTLRQLSAFYDAKLSSHDVV